jgi:hypothetical protein
MLLKNFDKKLRRVRADLPDRLRGVAAALQFFFVRQRLGLANNRCGFLRLVAQKIERPAVETLRPIRCFMFETLQRRDVLLDRGLYFLGKSAAAHGIRVGN